MDKFLLALIVALSLAGCQSTPDTTAGTEVVAKSKQGMISHLVFFDLRDSLNSQELQKVGIILKSLNGIPVVEDFTVGDFKDLEDARALSEYEVVIQMSFKNKEDYLTYQNHRLHRAAKKKLGPYLTGPPKSYDYLIQ